MTAAALAAAEKYGLPQEPGGVTRLDAGTLTQWAKRVPGGWLYITRTIEEPWEQEAGGPPASVALTSTFVPDPEVING